MMLVTYKSDPVNGPSKLRSKEIGERIREACYYKDLSLIPGNFEDGNLKFVEGTLSGDSGFSSTFAVKSYEFLGQKCDRSRLSGKTVCFLFS